jgi:hypothetical protein
MSEYRATPWVHAGIFIVSGVALAQEILLTRVLALMLWHHLTPVVIGIALLGFGAAGSYVAARNTRAAPRRPPGRRLLIPALALAVTSPLCYAALTRVSIAPSELLAHPGQWAALLLVYSLIALPFFCTGLVVCVAIDSYPRRVGSIYFADLVGAGLGAGLAVVALPLLGAPGALVATGVGAALAAACFAVQAATEQRGHRTAAIARTVTCLLVGAVLAAYPLRWATSGLLDPPLAPDKELAAHTRHAAVHVEESHWTPLARIDVTAPLLLRPAMGGAFPPDPPVVPFRGIYQDGTAPTLLLGEVDAPAEAAWLRGASAAAGHAALAARGAENIEQMVIGVGGGVDLWIALAWGVERVTGVEINPATLALLQEVHTAFTGDLADDPRVELVNAEGRHFARRSRGAYDLIQLSGVDTYTALASGAHTLSESYLYTREAVEEFLRALTERGVLSYTRIVFEDEPRETLRLVAAGLEALERETGADAPGEHLFLLSGDSWASVLISRQAFSGGELAALREFAERGSYDVLYDPSAPRANAFDDLARRSPAERQAFFAAYPFRVRPAVDDRPFFFHYFRWGSLFDVDEYGGHPYHARFPHGLGFLLLGLVQTALLALVFVLRPVALLGRIRGRRSTLAALAYFAALGVGFITVEIVLIQRLVLFLGHPTRSMTVVLPTTLIAAGLGALTVRPSIDPARRLRRLIVWIPAAIVAGWALTSFALDPLLGLPLEGRIGVTILVLAPVGFALGQAFPVGIRLVAPTRPELIPWAWAINAFTTVLGSTGAVLVAMELGFTAVLLATVPVYVIGLLALRGFESRTAAPVSTSKAA